MSNKLEGYETPKAYFKRTERSRRCKKHPASSNWDVYRRCDGIFIGAVRFSSEAAAYVVYRDGDLYEDAGSFGSLVAACEHLCSLLGPDYASVVYAA